jgi:hypothetical protein
MNRPTLDDLKMQRDGTLAWGEKVDPDPHPGSEWVLFRDADGVTSMGWLGPEQRQRIREWKERQQARRRAERQQATDGGL